MLQRILLIILVSSFVSCCTFKWRRDNAKSEKNSSPGRDEHYQNAVANHQLRTDLQLRCLKQADQLGAQSFFGLFSEAGYVDGGQTAVYILDSGNAKIEHMLPGHNEFGQLREVSKSKIQPWLEKVNATEKLPDYTKPSFDGVRHEYVHFRRASADEPLQLDHKVFIMTLLEGSDSELYRRFLDIFNEVRTIE
jgi:hypothetical protein